MYFAFSNEMGMEWEDCGVVFGDDDRGVVGLQYPCRDD
jgi:hypothetical protein